MDLPVSGGLVEDDHHARSLESERSMTLAKYACQSRSQRLFLFWQMCPTRRGFGHKRALAIKVPPQIFIFLPIFQHSVLVFARLAGSRQWQISLVTGPYLCGARSQKKSDISWSQLIEVTLTPQVLCRKNLRSTSKASKTKTAECEQILTDCKFDGDAKFEVAHMIYIKAYTS